MSEHLDPRTVELSKRLSAALDAGNIPEALELMSQLRPLYLDAWNEAINGKARRSEDRGLHGRLARCGNVGVSGNDLLMREISEYRVQGGTD